MGAIVIIYTALCGLKAVIYTDIFQWILLILGLVFIVLPFAYLEIGGLEGIRSSVAPEMLSLTNISWQDMVYWAVTIIPIWFVGMTLYQRIYACKDEKTAKRAWYLAGLFEWPVMAFLGVLLEIGRASWREGVWSWGWGGCL